MPKVKFTQKGMEALTATPHPQRVDYFDTATPGLCLTIGPRAATWYYFKRIDGRLTRMTLGEWGEVGIAKARRKAAEVEQQIAEGKHPKAEQARQRAAERESRALDHARIVRKVADGWAAAHFPTLAASTQADYRRALDDFVAVFGDEDIGSIRRGAVMRHLDRIKARSASGTAANRAAVVIRQLFAYARDRYDLETNPVGDIRNPVKQAKRSRTLNRDEIRVLWRACELAGYPYGHALRVALCTGQRIGEVGMMRRSDVDGDYWQQADNKSKQRIDIYLAPHARAVLKDCPDYGPEAFYLSASGGARGLRSDTWSNALPRHITPQVNAAAKELGLHAITKHWTPHDLRRTVRTALTGWCGVSPDTAERVLNHAIGGLRAVYDHADYRPHVADALQRWDKELSAILKGKAPTVVSLAERQRTKRRAG